MNLIRVARVFFANIDDFEIDRYANKYLRKSAISEGQKMLIGNLPLDVKDDDLVKLFETIGKVQSVEILRDKSGRAKGFAFLTMPNPKEKEQALKIFHNAEFKGRILTLSSAKTLPCSKPKGLFDLFRFGFAK